MIKRTTRGLNFVRAVGLHLLATFAAAANGPLFPGRLYEVGDGPIAVVAVDLNGDGALDLASANEESYGQSLSVLINRGDGDFDDAVHYPITAFLADLAAGDLDCDGDADLAVAGGNSRVYLRLNNGDGTLYNGGSCGGMACVMAVVLDDFDGDGWLDVAAADLIDDVVTVFLNDPEEIFARDEGGCPPVLGGVTFAPGVSYDVGEFPFDLVVGDINGDGRPDLVTADYFSDSASVLLNLGDGTFGPARAYAVGDAPMCVGLGDADGDGQPELFATIYGIDDLQIWPNLGDGSFGPPAYVPIGGSGGPFVLADQNDDGRLDLTAYSGEQTVILLNDGVGGWTVPVHYASADGAYAYANGDLNGDGTPDLAFCKKHKDTIGAIFGRGDGTYESATAYDVGVTPQEFVLGDLNGDGWPDLAIAPYPSYPDGKITIIWNAGNGSFGSATQYDAGEGPVAVALSDLNQDGNLDMSVVTSWANSVSILLNQGDGAFEMPVEYGVGAAPLSIVTDDWDGDGHIDLAATNTQTGNISLLLNHGDGTFAPAVHYEVGDHPVRITSADLNGDLRPDLAVTHYPYSLVSISYNNGDGTFADAVYMDIGLQPLSIAAGDLNGDGSHELIIGCSGRILILWNRGDGTFENPFPITALNSSTDIAIHDIDQDGLLDLLIAESSRNDMAILFNMTNGQFSMPYRFCAGETPEWFAISDLDGDGWEDLVTGGRYNQDVVILLNQHSRVVGDVDGDGDVDLMDLIALLGAYGTNENDIYFNVHADFDGNGIIALSDLAALLSNFGTASGLS